MLSEGSMAHVGNGELVRAVALSPDELVAETRCGAGLARAIVEHVHRMGVSGYSDEVVVNGETWVVSAVPKQNVA